MRDLRLIPVVTLAALALFLLKVSGLVLDRGYALISSRSALAEGIAMPPVVGLDPQSSAAAPDEPIRRGDRRPSVEDSPDYTGSVAAAPKPPDAPPAKAPNAPPPGPTPGAIDLTKPPMTAGEKAVLESLVQRRQEIEARAREIDVRENLLKAAEQRIDQRMEELKAAEARLTGLAKERTEAETAKFKALVSMYENMKAKEAAKVFDRLELRILVEIVNAMNPRRMSDILALMSAEAAEKLTIEIANRSGPDRPAPALDLPKIPGVPNKS